MDVDRRIHRQMVHVLDAADHLHVFCASGDGMAGLSDRLEGRSAESIHRGARDRKRQARHQGGAAGHVAAEFATLLRRAQHDILDCFGIDTAAVDCSADHRRGQLIAANPAKYATFGMGPTDRRAAAGDNDGSRSGQVGD